MSTYSKALALTSALAIVSVGGAFWLMWNFLPLLLRAPFFSTTGILLVASVGLALLIRTDNRHKRREEQALREDASRTREREEREREAREHEEARQLGALEAEVREAKREAEESRKREAAQAAEATRRFLEEERERGLLEAENEELRAELARAALMRRLEEEQAERRYSTSLYRRSIESEARGGWGQGNVAVLRELEELGLDKQNAATIGRLVDYGGGLAHAEEGSDGRMRAQIRIPEAQLIFSPSILVMPHGGEIELELFNDDTNPHSALLPSNGDYQWIWLPSYSRGTASLELDGPGYYWYGSNVGNDEGQGLRGAIVVMGDVPEHARLDRPNQPRP